MKTSIILIVSIVVLYLVVKKMISDYDYKKQLRGDKPQRSYNGKMAPMNVDRWI